jgi:large subunit ribosomal protein L24
MKIRKGDNVIMLNGKDRGKKGAVVKTSPETGKVVVEGLNMVKNFKRAKKQGQKGQIIAKERYVSASSVALVCKACGKQTRIGYRVDDKSKTRICKKCEAEV